LPDAISVDDTKSTIEIVLYKVQGTSAEAISKGQWDNRKAKQLCALIGPNALALSTEN
jgi:hypothetical protein